MEDARKIERKPGVVQFGWVIVDPLDPNDVINRYKVFFGVFKRSIRITSGELMGKYKILVESNLFTHKHVGDKIPTYEVDVDLNVKRLT